MCSGKGHRRWKARMVGATTTTTWQEGPVVEHQESSW